LSFVEAMHPGAFDSTDVHEHILAAVIRLDEAEAFLAIKPFYRALRHMTFFQVRVSWAAQLCGPVMFEIWEGR
jgi:hypothetical protein